MPSGREGLGTWPRFTPVQRALLIRFDRSKYGDLYIAGMTLRSLWTLLAEGMVSGNGSSWYGITQRGRDYVRFGLPKKRKLATPNREES